MLDDHTLAIHQLQVLIRELEELISYSVKQGCTGNEDRRELLNQLKEELELAKGLG